MRRGRDAPKETKMKTMQDECRDYLDSVFPDGMSGVQNKELHQAFFAGALSYTLLVLKASNNMSEDDAMKYLDKLGSEIMKISLARAQLARDRN